MGGCNGVHRRRGRGEADKERLTLAVCLSGILWRAATDANIYKGLKAYIIVVSKRYFLLLEFGGTACRVVCGSSHLSTASNVAIMGLWSDATPQFGMNGI